MTKGLCVIRCTIERNDAILVIRSFTAIIATALTTMNDLMNAVRVTYRQERRAIKLIFRFL